MRKKIFGIGVFIVAALVALHFYSAYFIVEIKNPIIEFIRPMPDRAGDFSTIGLNGKEIIFEAKDGMKMSAYLAYANSDSVKNTIVLVHGIRADKYQYSSMMKRITKEGFNAVAIDLRAHGNSQGRYCTFGAKEKYDISALLDYLEQHESIYKIGIWGQSLGGAVALQAMANDERIKFGVIESTFNNLTNVVHQYAHNYLGFNVRLLTNHVLRRAGQIADFDPLQVSPKMACKHIRQPILMAHGTADQRIPIAFGRSNFNNLKSQQKEFIEIPTAGHGGVWRVGGDDYFNRVFDFFKRQ